MVQVRQNRPSEACPLVLDGKKVAGNRVAYAVPALGPDQLAKVARVDVNGQRLEAVGDLLALDQQELSGALKESPKLVQWLQSNLDLPVGFARLDPFSSETRAIPFQRVNRPPF